MDPANAYPHRQFPNALRLLAETYPKADLHAAFETHRAELEGCRSEQECFTKLAAYLEADKPPTPAPMLARLAAGDADALRELTKATPRPLPERELADRECRPSRLPWDKPTPTRKNYPPELRTPVKGRGAVPWGLFIAAGFDPRLLTAPERSIVKTVYRVHSLRQGWTNRDRATAQQPGIPLLPTRQARILSTTVRTIKRSIRRLVACELLAVTERVPGYAPLYASGWWHGTDAEADNLAALRRSLALLTRRRPPHPGGRGQSRQTRRQSVDNSPSVPSSVVGSVPPSVPPSVPGGGVTEEKANPLPVPELQSRKSTLPNAILNLRREKEEILEEPGVATPSLRTDGEDAEGEASPRGDESNASGMPEAIDWDELRRLACSKLALKLAATQGA